MRQDGRPAVRDARATGARTSNAYLDDYAFMIQGLLDLYESDFDARWLREALALDAIVREQLRGRASTAATSRPATTTSR